MCGDGIADSYLEISFIRPLSGIEQEYSWFARVDGHLKMCTRHVYVCAGSEISGGDWTLKLGDGGSNDLLFKRERELGNEGVWTDHALN